MTKNTIAFKTLRRLLESGETPRSLGAKRIGRGAFRIAYAYKGWVIKSAGHHSLTGRKSIRSIGIHPVRTERIGEWHVQPYVGKPTAASLRLWMTRYARTLGPRQLRDFFEDVTGCVSVQDLHIDNVGQDKRGRLVAFDW